MLAGYLVLQDVEHLQHFSKLSNILILASSMMFYETQIGHSNSNIFNQTFYLNTTQRYMM